MNYMRIETYRHSPCYATIDFFDSQVKVSNVSNIISFDQVSSIGSNGKPRSWDHHCNHQPAQFHRSERYPPSKRATGSLLRLLHVSVAGSYLST